MRNFIITTLSIVSLGISASSFADLLFSLDLGLTKWKESLPGMAMPTSVCLILLSLSFLIGSIEMHQVKRNLDKLTK